MEVLAETQYHEPPTADSALASILNALPFAVYGIDRDLVIRYNNHRDVLRDFLADDNLEPPTNLLGSNLLDHVPAVERPALGKLLQDVLDDSASAGRGSLRGVEFLHASAQGLQRLRVIATPAPDCVDGIAVLLTCHESEVNAPPAGQTPSGSARIEVARQLAATLNHEINNPLFIVSATLEDLLAETEDTAAQRRLRAALDSVWRVASAVKQLQEIRHIVTTAYIEGLDMVDLDASAAAETGESQQTGGDR